MFDRKVFFCAVLLAVMGANAAFAHGAIAVGDKSVDVKDASSERHFITSGHASPDVAQSLMMRACKEAGLHFCRIASWFDQCGAYASSGVTSGTGTGPTRKEAEQMAEKSCGKNCKVVAVQCDGDKSI